MKLVKVSPEPFSYLHCIAPDCQRKGFHNTSTKEAFADLDGAAYKAYYCPDCAAKIQKLGASSTPDHYALILL